MNHLDAYHLALSLIKKAGFELHTASAQSEACYYFHPSRKPYLLRIAQHRQKRSHMGMSNTVAKVTFSTKHDFSQQYVRSALALAIGRYFLDDPKPSEYYGKKGTWEHHLGHATVSYAKEAPTGEHEAAQQGQVQSEPQI
jgi:hypothetical protein